MDPAGLEMQATARRFDEVCARWRLTPDEVAILLDPAMEGSASKIERRKRLIIELDDALRDIIGSEFVPNWLRSQGPGGDPITFLALEDGYLPALLDVARTLVRK